MSAPPVPYVSSTGVGGPGWDARTHTLRSLQVATIGDDLVAWVRDGKAVRSTVRGGRDVSTLVAEVWTDEDSRLVVFDDKSTFRRLRKVLDGNGFRAVERQLELAASWRGSTRLVIVPTVLAQAWWEPTGGYGDYAAWAGHFGLDRDDHVVTLDRLLWCALAGEASEWQQSMIKKIVELEGASLEVRGERSFAGADAAAYLMGGGISSLWTHYLDHDPMRVREGLFTGAVTAVTGLRTAGTNVSGSLSNVSKLKADKEVIVFASDTGERIGNAIVAGLGYNVRDGVTAEFTTSSGTRLRPGKGASRGFGALLDTARARDTAAVFYVAEDGYVPLPRGTVWSNWTKAELAADARVTRDVPLDVILAGG